MKKKLIQPLWLFQNGNIRLFIETLCPALSCGESFIQGWFVVAQMI